MLLLNDFLNHISKFQNKELITPKESSELQILIVELLIEQDVEIQLLKYLSRFFTSQFYNEIIEERNIEHKCGYFVCSKTHFTLYNRKPSIILPMTWKNKYCCKEHYQSSLFYEKQLSDELLMLRNDIFTIKPFPEFKPLYYENNITCLEEILNEQKSTGKSLTEIIEMMSGLTMSEKDPNTDELIKLVEDFEIIEKENEPEDDFNGYITTDKSFGGYVV